MRLERFTNGKLVVRIGARERKVFENLLQLYPMVPPAHQQISQSGSVPDAQATQRLLDEALAEQRAENKQQVKKLLADPARWAPGREGTRLTLSPAEVEWLLQVFNDVRVGSWIQLGAPEGRIPELKAENARLVWAMEMAGFFEAEFLAALEAGPDSALERH